MAAKPKPKTLRPLHPRFVRPGETDEEARARRRRPTGGWWSKFPTFWERVAVGEPDACWEWLGPKPRYADGRGGYGSVSYEGRTHAAHKVAYLRNVGPVPEGMDVCHSCDNRGCCNPKHLYLATHSQNLLDCKQRGRLRNPFGFRLTEADVRQILELATAGKSGTAIAKRFKMEPSCIYNILTGKTWKDVPRPEGFLAAWRKGGAERQREGARLSGRVEHVCACGRKTKGNGHYSHVKRCATAQGLTEQCSVS